VERLDPNLANVLKLQLEPMCMKFNKEQLLPKLMFPITDCALPNRENPLIDIVEPMTK
jgi:hypothetical protein